MRELLFQLFTSLLHTCDTIQNQDKTASKNPGELVNHGQIDVKIRL